MASDVNRAPLEGKTTERSSPQEVISLLSEAEDAKEVGRNVKQDLVPRHAATLSDMEVRLPSPPPRAATDLPAAAAAVTAVTTTAMVKTDVCCRLRSLQALYDHELQEVKRTNALLAERLERIAAMGHELQSLHAQMQDEITAKRA